MLFLNYPKSMSIYLVSKIESILKPRVFDLHINDDIQSEYTIKPYKKMH